VSYADGFTKDPRPVYGAGMVLLETGFNTPSIMAVLPDGSGDVTRSQIACETTRGAPYTPTPIFVGDELYFVSDTGVLSCLDARYGRFFWQQRIGGNYSASPIFADGRLYFLSEEGVATVIAPGRTYQPLAVNRLDGASRHRATRARDKEGRAFRFA
jgi:outer membrane protein assembly factor BamB